MIAMDKAQARSIWEVRENVAAAFVAEGHVRSGVR